MRFLSCLSVCMCSPLIVARQQTGKHVLVAKNTRATIENCWKCFICCPCRIKGKQAISSSQNFLFYFKYSQTYFIYSRSVVFHDSHSGGPGFECSIGCQFFFKVFIHGILPEALQLTSGTVS
jgi:hypothetical protein